MTLPSKPVHQQEGMRPQESRFTQTEMPKFTLEKALAIPRALVDGYGSKPAAPHLVAQAVDLSPTSSGWRLLTGAAVAYGLTDGGYNANQIGLATLGRRILASTQEGDDRRATLEAVLTPRVCKAFFERYNRQKFPPEKIAMNVLQHELGVPSDRVEEAYRIILANGKFAGIIHETKTGPFVALDASPPGSRPPDQKEDFQGDDQRDAEGLQDLTRVQPDKRNGSGTTRLKANRVFIAHGKNKQVVTQLKELLTFGKLEPVVAEETETTSKPIPEKVLGDMRSCFAGILHVASEEELLDKEGKMHHKLNENVLIEIGAAMALYGRNVILLAQKGVHMPSNLQGLYVCYYEGEKLDGDATMKLLKSFNDLQKPKVE